MGHNCSWSKSFLTHTMAYGSIYIKAMELMVANIRNYCSKITSLCATHLGHVPSNSIALLGQFSTFTLPTYAFYFRWGLYRPWCTWNWSCNIVLYVCATINNSVLLGESVYTDKVTTRNTQNHCVMTGRWRGRESESENMERYAVITCHTYVTDSHMRMYQQKSEEYDKVYGLWTWPTCKGLAFMYVHGIYP